MENQSSFKLALVQMRVEGGGKAANLARACARIEQAATAGAHVILLPEALNLGWTHPSAYDQADPIPRSSWVDTLRESARAHRVYLCFGLVEAAPEGRFNSALLLDPEGRILLHHRKVYELEIARDFYRTGSRLATARTRWGTLGLMICADAFAPGQVISRSLGLLGAEVILSPCCWAVPADHDQAREPYGRLWLENYGPVARDFRLWIAGASNVGPVTEGPWQGRHCIGCSLLVGPDGAPRLMGPYGTEAETILYALIHPERDRPYGDGWERRQDEDR